MPPRHLLALAFLACAPSSPASDASSTSETTQAASETTSEAPPCDDDPACGPDEDATRCPAQCNVCGDGLVFGAEACDNGDDNRSYWPDGAPPDACSEACDTLFHRCGDATLDAEHGEACDNGSNNDPAHAPSQPAPGACAQGCRAVRFCGDAQVDSDDGETCDLGPQNQSYWPATPPARACSGACDTTLEWCGDANQNGPEACDNGINQDPPYTPTIPAAPGPCAAGCTLPRFCGDTLLDPDHGEACDDGNNNDGDGCSADCLHTERHVFVSSTILEGDLQKDKNNPQQLTGLTLADARCQALAAAAGLPGTFKAWLSDGANSPATRLDTRFTGLYRLTTPGHPIIAAGWSGLTTMPLLHPIDADESGAAASGKIVWTNTLPDGTQASNLHCNNWSSSKDVDTTTVGSSSKTDPAWTNLGGGQFCALANRLYCFEDP